MCGENNNSCIAIGQANQKIVLSIASMKSMLLLGASGGMPTGKVFLKLNLRAFSRDHNNNSYISCTHIIFVHFPKYKFSQMGSYFMRIYSGLLYEV